MKGDKEYEKEVRYSGGNHMSGWSGGYDFPSVKGQ